MKRKVFKFLVLGTFVIIGTGLLSWPTFLKYLLQTNLQEAKKQGAAISWSGLSTGMASVGLESFSTWIPGPRVMGPVRIPVSLELQKVAAKLHSNSFFALTPIVSYSMALYGGTIDGDARTDGDVANITARIANVELGKHPQIAALGVQGGAIVATVRDIQLTPDGPAGGSFSLKVQDLAPPLLDVARSLLRVDNLGTLNFEADGSISPKSIKVSRMNLSSLFGTVSGELVATEHLSKAPQLKGEFHVSLSEKGSSTFGAWLPYIPGADLDSSTTAFRINATSTPCSAAGGTTMVVNLGSGCVKFIFFRQ